MEELFQTTVGPVLNGLRIDSKVFETDFVGVQGISICSQHENMLRYNIYDLSELSLRLLAILDIRPSGIPANDISLFVSKGIETDQKPAILPVFSEYSGFGFPTHPSGYCIFACQPHSIKIFGMKDPRAKVVCLRLF